MDKKTANKIYGILEKEYPEVTTALEYKTPLQLLVSTVLAAQCTDKRVNMVTKGLFKKYKSAKDYARAKTSDLEGEIRSTGFYKNKSRNIIAACRTIEDNFGGKVPETMEGLVSLPGVARKTANIVLFHAFGKNEGVAVDTHVRRLSGRLGFTRESDPAKIEKDLMKIFPKSKWGKVNSVLVAHGRAVCVARKPLCPGCPVNKLCPSAELS